MARQAFILFLLLLGLGSPIWARATNIEATLVAESAAPAPGVKTAIAIRMRPAPGWHGYWINPGDAGLPATLDWSLPAGVTASPLRYPVPKTLIIAGLMNHVYEGEYALLTSLTLPATMKPGTRVPIRAKATWLACTDKICVPERAELSLDLVTGDGAIEPATRATFDGWRKALPRPLGSPATYTVEGDRFRIAIPFPASAPANRPWFFAETDKALSYVADQKAGRQGDVLIIETKAAGTRPDGPVTGVLATGPDTGFQVEARPGTVPALAETGVVAILLALGGSLLGGLLLNIMPCVFPVISLKALNLARTGGDEQQAKRESLAYAAGAVLTCLALGGALLALRASGMAVGWAFQLQNPWVIGFLLFLSLAITANLLGWFQLRSFGGGEALAGKGGVAGSFWTGVLAAFVATPCTGPFMAAALGAALVLPAPAAMAIFAGLGLGMAIPFLLIGFVPALRQRFPKPGPWMKTFQRALAVPMILTALALYWLLWRQLSPPPPSAFMEKGTSAYTEAGLSRLRGEGRPVFLYFTADWCITCKVNEAAAINRAEVRDAFTRNGVTIMIGDWTNGDPAITRFLESRGRSGVPLYLWYDGKAEPVELPQVLTPGLLLEKAQPRPR